jgi:hypothetical protein
LNGVVAEGVGLLLEQAIDGDHVVEGFFVVIDELGRADLLELLDAGLG